MSQRRRAPLITWTQPPVQSFTYFVRAHEDPSRTAMLILGRHGKPDIVPPTMAHSYGRSAGSRLALIALVAGAVTVAATPAARAQDRREGVKLEIDAIGGV